MCGFVGVVGKHIENPLELIGLIAHRGPDDSGFHREDGLFFGHARLAILDLSSKGKQPMCDADEEILILFNGEIYNFLDLRKELQERGVKFRSRSDTEVLIYLYKHMGVRFLDRLNGMFSVAILDRRTDRIILARDRFGKKPLYYCESKGRLVFASEIKAILNVLDHRPGIDLIALRQYLSFLAALPPRTFFEGVNKLEAGHYLVYEKGEIRSIERYYHLPPVGTVPKDPEETREIVSEYLHRSVERRLVSDVEVGVLLSGGLDSSLLTAEYLAMSREPVHTFSIGYEEYRDRYDELGFAEAAASHLGTVHHPLIASRRDFVDALEEVVYHLDEPINDPATVPVYLLSKWVRDHGIKVCLSGEGSDELFLGYSLYPMMQEYYGIRRGERDYVVPASYMKEEEYAKRAADGRGIYRSIGEYFATGDEWIDRLLAGRAPEDDSWSFIQKYWDLFQNAGQRPSIKADPVKWCSFIDLHVWIAEVLMMKVDKMSMAHGLEVRAPFLDHELVELAYSIPTEFLMNKAPLRAIAAGRLPPAIIDRRKKGFSSPFLEWFYAELGDEILDTIRSVNRKLHLFSDDQLDFFYRQGELGRCKHTIWGLYIFARWCNVYHMV